jgi:CMP-N-acetylneuraminic acid synthetase
MNILTIIPARGGSKRIYKKNIRPLAGIPLIGWTIEAALRARIPQRVIVSTDDANIAQVSKSFGAEVPFMRPAEIASDTATSIEVVLHALEWWVSAENTTPDMIMLLQPTSPLRTTGDIEAAFDLYQDKTAEAVVSVCDIQHPITWVKKIGSHGELLHWQANRQTLPGEEGERLCRLNGALYLIAYKTLLRERTFIPTRTFAYVMPPDRSIDIDTPWEFRLAELVLKDRDVLQSL